MKRTLLACLCPMLFLSACHRRDSGNALSLSGTVELTEYKAGTRVAGRVVKVFTEESARVKQNDPIAELDRYEQSIRDYHRAIDNFKAGGGSQQALEQARLAMQDQRVLSPIDGIVLEQVYRPGEVAPSGAPVFVIGDPQDMWVRVFVPEGEINRVKIGQRATIHLDGVPTEVEGHVTVVATKAEFTPRNVQTPEERVLQVFAVKVKIDHPIAQLRPGVSADVRLSLDES